MSFTIPMMALLIKLIRGVINSELTFSEVSYQIRKGLI